MTSLREKLEEYFRRGVKESGSGGVGVEVEHFVTDAAGRPVSYFGSRGVGEVLRRHFERCKGAVPFAEGGNLLGFAAKGFSVSLEPAAQYEVSVEPLGRIADTEGAYDSFFMDFGGIVSQLGHFVRCEGYCPFGAARELDLIPKSRYAVMDRYFSDKGTDAVEMMRGTASTQVSVDYFSEGDFVRKIRVAHFLSPLLQLVAENTGDCGGRFSRHLKRAAIWNATDADRCGVVPGVFSSGFGFAAYADYLCTRPSLLRVLSSGASVATGTVPAGEVYAGGFGDEDMRTVMSLVFPWVRLKNYLEIRVADSLPKKQMLGYVALVKGIMYSEETLSELCSRLKSLGVTEGDAKMTEADFMERGWGAAFYGVSAAEAAEELFSLASAGLDSGERGYLEPLRKKVSEDKGRR